MLTALGRRCRRHDDEGAVLILAMLMLMLFGLILAAQFGEASANQSSTTFVRAHLDNVYAADAGIEAALQRIRQDPNFCAQPAANASTTPTADIVNFRGLTAGHDVSVACTVGSVNAVVPGVAGYAAIVLSQNGDGSNNGNGAALTTTNGASEKVITGPVYLSGGTDLTHVLRMQEGDIDLRCNTGISNSSVTFDDGYGFRSCRPKPVVRHQLPSPPCTLASAAICLPSPVGYAFTNAAYSNCRLFLPGRYVVPPAIVTGMTNYFASGVYDFAFTAASPSLGISGTNTKVVAGRQSTPVDTDACATADPTAADIVAPAPNLSLVSGLGATFVFSGGSFIDMGASGSLQVYPRITSTTETQKLNIVALDNLTDDGTSNSAWALSTLSTARNEIVQRQGGSTTTEVISGAYYTPAAKLEVSATTGTVARFLDGVVVSQLTVGETPPGDNLQLGISQGTSNLSLKLVSTATPTSTGDSSYGGKAVTSVARVTVSTAAGRPVTVNSWRSNAPDAP